MWGEQTNPGHERLDDHQRESHTERRDHEIGFSVVAVVDRVVPSIERLDERCAQTNSQNQRADEPPASHGFECNTRETASQERDHKRLTRGNSVVT